MHSNRTTRVYRFHQTLPLHGKGRQRQTNFSYNQRTAYDFDLNVDDLVLLDFKALISECSDFD